MDVLRSFHDEIGRLVVQYQGTIGYRAGDGAMGMIGTEGRFDYTPIGNALNLSARLSEPGKERSNSDQPPSSGKHLTPGQRRASR